MDFALAIDSTGYGQMSFDAETSIRNNIYLSLMTQRGSFFVDPAFGSRLHMLARAKNTDQTAQRAIGYAQQALQWMIDTGRVRAINVLAQRDPARDRHRLYLLVEATPVNSDEPVLFSTFIEVI